MSRNRTRNVESVVHHLHNYFQGLTLISIGTQCSSFLCRELLCVWITMCQCHFVVWRWVLTPVWRLKTKLSKGAWNISANNSKTVGHKDLRQIVYILEIRVSQKLAKLGGVGRPIKCQGWKVRDNQSKLCSLGGQVSTLALILECEMYLISFWLE